MTKESLKKKKKKKKKRERELELENFILKDSTSGSVKNQSLQSY